MAVAGVILAGGRSARMGSPKALLDYRGAPFVVRILEVLEVLELRPRVVVVGPAGSGVRHALAGRDCVVVDSPDVDGGPIASLRAALQVLGPVQPAGVLAWPVDLPHVRLTTVERLLDTHRQDRPAVVAPAFGDRRGHPVLWDASMFEELRSNAAATRDGARAVLRAHPAAVRTVAVDDPAVVDSLNTPEDYQRLVRSVNRDIY
ncbi:MAG TPA: nucleotidyltransferase family protein [Gemmatimonadales bacterium]|jgi:CTP:molybdopterin cytidylyltransferase MocA|nr:nucleotidyltransferase family protein [Gemmatimonadales bacterium]